MRAGAVDAVHVAACRLTKLGFDAFFGLHGKHEAEQRNDAVATLEWLSRVAQQVGGAAGACAGDPHAAPLRVGGALA